MAVTPMSLPAPPGLGTGSAWSAEVSLGSGHRAQAHATRWSQQQAALTASRGIEATSPVRQAWLSTPHGGDKGSRAWLRETPRTPAGHRGVGSLGHCHVAGASLWSPAPCGQRPPLLTAPSCSPFQREDPTRAPGHPQSRDSRRTLVPGVRCVWGCGHSWSPCSPEDRAQPPSGGPPCKG